LIRANNDSWKKSKRGDMPSTIFLNLLGEFELYYQCGPADSKRLLLKPPTKKSISLLAYLAVYRNHRFTRDHLIEMFWGDRQEDKARRSLTTALWQIRVCIPDDTFLLCTTQYIQIDSRCKVVVDIDEFREKASSNQWDDLSASLSLYRGEFMEGLYDDWIINDRYQLENVYLSILDKVLHYQLSLEQYRTALETAQLLLKHDALREDAYRGAMLCYYHLGQKQAILEIFRRCQKNLETELEIEPAAETTELFQNLIGRSSTMDRQISDEHGLSAVVIEPKIKRGTDFLGLDQFFGRSSEMYNLELFWLKVCKGKQLFALIRGETGIGKSRLCEEFSKVVIYQGGSVVKAQFHEFEQEMPYQPILEVMRVLCSTLTQKELSDYPYWILEELAHLIPEIALKKTVIRRMSISGYEQNKARLFESILWFFRPLFRNKRILFLLEDLHWCTGSTLLLIRYLIHHLFDCQVLFLGTQRSEKIYSHPALAALSEELALAGRLLELDLQPLTFFSLDNFVVENFDFGQMSKRLSELLFCESEGNPLYLVQLIRFLVDTGMLRQGQKGWEGDIKRIFSKHLPIPDRFIQVIQTRVSYLSDPEQEILNAASISGRIIDYDVLKEVTGGSDVDVLIALNKFLRNGLIRECFATEEGDYSFAHSKIREVVYNGIDRRQRIALHARIAHAMEKTYAGNTDRIYTDLAYHFLLGRFHDQSLTERTIFYLLKAGDQARNLMAYQEAINYYKRAEAITDERQDHSSTYRIYFKLALAYHLAQDFVHANDMYLTGFKLKHSQIPQQEDGIPGQIALRVSTPPLLTLDPLLAYDRTSMEVIQQLFAGLVEVNPEMDILPSVAESWEISGDGRKYTFHLRKDACWSDGSPVTAFNFEESFHKVLIPNSNSPFASTFYFIRGGKAGIENQPNFSVAASAHDSSTLVIELTCPSSHFLYQLLFCLPISTDAVRQISKTPHQLPSIRTNGAFLVDQYDPGKSLTIVRNHSYRGEIKGNLNRIEIDIRSEGDTSTALEQYSLHLVDIVDFSARPCLELENIREAHYPNLVSGPEISTCITGFDQSQTPFDNRSVRKAFAEAIDRTYLAEHVLHSCVSPARGGFIPTAIPGYNVEAGIAYDPEESQQLLTEAGYQKGQGLPPLRAMLLDSAEFRLVKDYLQGQWKEYLGVDSVWSFASNYPEFLERIIQERPHLLISQWIAIYADPDYFLRVGIEDTRSFTHWACLQYDRLIEKAFQCRDQKEKLQTYMDADKLLMDEVAVIPLFYSRVHQLIQPSIARVNQFNPLQWVWKDISITTS
jgi:oligopeptide transport system substrate-binding protein